MKIIILSLAILLGLGLTAYTQEKSFSGPYQVIIDLSQMKVKPSKLYFWQHDYGKAQYDSAKVVMNKAIFKGQIDQPMRAYIGSKRKKEREPADSRYTISIFLEPAILQVKPTDSLNKYTISGSRFSMDYEALKKMDTDYNFKIDAIYRKVDQLDKKDSLASKELNKKAGKLYDEYLKVANKNFVLTHLNSPVSLIALNNYVGLVINHPEAVDSVYQQLSPEVKHTKGGESLMVRLETAKKTRIGSMAIDFIQPDISGKPISLSSFKGKYVLLDFWANWCAPCRAENPFLVKAYARYKDKGFEILSVSLDGESNRMKWLKAIHDDHLESWTHVSDLKEFNNLPAKLYGIQAIPQNFLIDPSGKIIARDLRGEELSQKLAEILGR